MDLAAAQLTIIKKWRHIDLTYQHSFPIYTRFVLQANPTSSLSLCFLTRIFTNT